MASYLERFGVDKKELNGGASELLSTAVRCNWIRRSGSEPLPIFYLLKWYFSDLRNLPHHKFPSYKFEEIRDATLITNYILNRLDSYSEEPTQ